VLAGAGRTVVGRDALHAATEVVAERRRDALRARIDELATELEDAQTRHAEADAAVDQRAADRDGFVQAASWCESLPDVADRHAASLGDAEATLAERLRDSRDAARSLDRVLEQRATADAAITEARRQLAALAAGAADPTGARQQAASALAAQAESLEQRLSEAEAEARRRSEETKRAVTETELAIERLTREQRDRHERLLALVACLPGDARPPHVAEAIDHADLVADGLRAIAQDVDGELAGLRAVADRHRADCETRRRTLDALRSSVDRIAPEDAAEALAELVTSVTDGVVVLDDVVVTEDRGTDDGVLRALEAAEAAAPLVLLSSDPTVLGWAIDLPAARGVLAGPRTLDRFACDETAAEPTIQLPPPGGARPVAAAFSSTTAPSQGDHA